MSKREEIRARRKRERTRQRLTTILIVSGIALILVGLLILPNLTPVSGIQGILPHQRPMTKGTSMGDPAAPVVLEVFEDFQCSACRRFAETVEEDLIQDYIEPGHVQLVFRQYPFLGRESVSAAHASLCAADQDRFWDYHDILYANQTGENVGAYTDRRLEAYAETLGLELKSFSTCMDEGIHDETIREEFQRGADMGVTGTPAIFLNGTQISPGFVPAYPDLSAAIQQMLAEQTS